MEWHSAGTARSTPAHLWFGGERVDLQVVKRDYLGPAQAGEEIVEQFLVTDTRERIFRVRVRGGVTTVELACPGS